jgi:hypothetical protein
LANALFSHGQQLMTGGNSDLWLYLWLFVVDPVPKANQQAYGIRLRECAGMMN